MSLIARMRFAEAVAVAEESIAEVDGKHVEAELLLRAAIVRTGLGGNQGAFGDPYDELKRAAASVETPSPERRLAYQFLALPAALGREHVSEARRLAQSALDDENAARSSAELGRPMSIASLALGICGPTEPALRWSELAVAAMRRRASVFGLTTTLVNDASLRLSRGDIEGAEMDVVDVLQLRPELVPMVRMGVVGMQIGIAIERGQIAEGALLLVDEASHRSYRLRSS